MTAWQFNSEYSRRHHARTIGIDGPVIPEPIPLDRVVAENPDPTYATFINPQPAKRPTIFARIAMELNQRRPDIPFLSTGRSPACRPCAPVETQKAQRISTRLDL